MPEDEEGGFFRIQTEVVALLESSGRPQMEVATQVGISPSMLRNWRAVVRSGSARSRAAASPGLSPLPAPADQASEIARLKLARANRYADRPLVVTDARSPRPLYRVASGLAPRADWSTFSRSARSRETP